MSLPSEKAPVVVAHHEIGHVIAAHCLGIELLCVQIDYQEGSTVRSQEGRAVIEQPNGVC